MQSKSEKVPRTIRTYKKGSKNSLQNEHLDIHKINHRSAKEKDGINGLTVEGFKSGNQPLKPGYNYTPTRKSTDKLHRYGIMCENKK